MTLTYRSVKGSPLTIAEGDGNIHDLDDRVTAIEDNPPEARSIDSVSIAGNLLTITYTDATTDDITIPVATFRARGPWAAGETYAANDIVTNGGAAYLALQAFVAGSIFDADESDSDGALWGELIPAITTILASNVIYVGSTDTLPDVDNVQDAIDELATTTRSFRGVPGKESDDTTYEISPDDMTANYIRFTNAAGCTVTIPADDTDTAWELWDEVHIRAATDGDVIIDHDCDVTVHPPPDSVLTLLGNGATATLKRVGDNEWDVMGLFVADAGSS